MIFADDDRNNSRYSSIYFYVDEGGPVRVYLSRPLEDPERLLAPSQRALPLMRAVDDSLDDLMTAWVMHPERFDLQILDNDGELFSEEMAEEQRKVLAAMLGVKGRVEE